jgi:hypothetical protein
MQDNHKLGLLMLYGTLAGTYEFAALIWDFDFITSSHLVHAFNRVQGRLHSFYSLGPTPPFLKEATFSPL